MSKQKLKDKKQKKREVDAHKKVLRRRAAKRKQTRKEKELDREIKANQMKGVTFMKDETKERVEVEEKVFAKAQLAHNIDILKALEEEYDKEQENRVVLNEDLEGKGLNTLEEKMEYMQDQVLKKQKEVDKIDNKEAGNFSYEMGTGGGLGGLTN